MTRQLNQDDIPVWLELATEVEPLFGSMVQNKEFQEGIRACIRKGDAFARIVHDGAVAGIIAIDRENSEISWLAVGKRFRGKKYGDDLVKRAIEELKMNGDIYVQTFSEENECGHSARKLYIDNGFTDFEFSGQNPAGISTVIMVRKK
jgi:GNAT superfamily N-acetyltransferase